MYKFIIQVIIFINFFFCFTVVSYTHDVSPPSTRLCLIRIGRRPNSYRTGRTIRRKLMNIAKIHRAAQRYFFVRDNIRVVFYEIPSNSNTELEECAICLNHFETIEEYRELKCMHKFHINCINRWIEQNDRCPLCRYQIYPPQLRIYGEENS